MCEGAYTKQPGNAKKKKTHAMDYAHAPAKTERTDHMQVTQTLEYGERIVCHACRKKKPTESHTGITIKHQTQFRIGAAAAEENQQVVVSNNIGLFSWKHEVKRR